MAPLYPSGLMSRPGLVHGNLEGSNILAMFQRKPILPSYKAIILPSITPTIETHILQTPTTPSLGAISEEIQVTLTPSKTSPASNQNLLNTLMSKYLRFPYWPDHESGTPMDHGHGLMGHLIGKHYNRLNNNSKRHVTSSTTSTASGAPAVPTSNSAPKDAVPLWPKRPQIGKGRYTPHGATPRLLSPSENKEVEFDLTRLEKRRPDQEGKSSALDNLDFNKIKEHLFPILSIPTQAFRAFNDAILASRNGTSHANKPGATSGKTGHVPARPSQRNKNIIDPTSIEDWEVNFAIPEQRDTPQQSEANTAGQAVQSPGDVDLTTQDDRDRDGGS